MWVSGDCGELGEVGVLGTLALDSGECEGASADAAGSLLRS